MKTEIFAFLMNFSLKFFGVPEICRTFASAFAPIRACQRRREIFERLTWREKVVREAMAATFVLSVRVEDTNRQLFICPALFAFVSRLRGAHIL
jgi:hypothetical protein